MGRAKEIVLKVIPASIANPFIRAHHYSGGVVTNSCLHFGVFLDGQLHGVMSYGPSMNKQKIATARVVDPFQEAFLFEETETLMRIALGPWRYELLYANKFKGIPAKDLAALTGRKVHTMRVALWRWQNICRKVLKSNGKIISIILWLHVNIPAFLGVLR